MYVIDGESFDFEVAGLVGTLSQDSVFWAIDVYGAARDSEKMGYVHPKFSINYLSHPDDASRSLAKMMFKDVEPYDYDIDNWIGDFYIYDAHHYKADIELTRTSATTYCIHIKGKVDVSWSNVEGHEYIPFEIRQEIPFHGFLCPSGQEKESRDVLGKICDDTKLYWADKDKSQFEVAVLSPKRLKQ